jgi:hypothetical protein
MIKIYFDWPDASQNVSIAFGKIIAFAYVWLAGL